MNVLLFSHYSTFFNPSRLGEIIVRIIQAIPEPSGSFKVIPGQFIFQLNADGNWSLPLVVKNHHSCLGPGNLKAAWTICYSVNNVIALLGKIYRRRLYFQGRTVGNLPEVNNGQVGDNEPGARLVPLLLGMAAPDPKASAGFLDNAQYRHMPNMLSPIDIAYPNRHLCRKVEFIR